MLQLKEAILKETKEGKLDLNGIQSLIKSLSRDIVEGILDEAIALPANKKQQLSKTSIDEALTKKQEELAVVIPKIKQSSITYPKEVSEFDQCIMYLYASGMPTRDMQEYIYDVFGNKVTPAMISMIVDRVMADARKWQQRPLDSVYFVVFFDALSYKVRENGKVVSKTIYSCFGINSTGHRELLGFWITSTVGTTYWLQVLNELKNRGLSDILIVCSDEINGLARAIQIVFPETEVQRCIAHMIRNSLVYLPTKYRSEFAGDLKGIYTALTESDAQTALESLLTKWGTEYPLAIRCWKENWQSVVSILKYPPALGKVLCSATTVESIHHQLRKIIQDRSVLIHDDALFNLLYLAALRLESKMQMHIRNWPAVATELHIIFQKKFDVR